MKVTVFNSTGKHRPLREFEPGDVVVLQGGDCPRLVTGNFSVTGLVTGSVYLPDRDDRDCEFIPIDEEPGGSLFTKVGNIAVEVSLKEND